MVQNQMYIKICWNGVVIIQADTTTTRFPCIRYFDYTLREAEQKYRNDYGLKGKHFQKHFVDYNIWS